MLHTLTYELDLLQDRTIQIKLPDTIRNHIQQQGMTEDMINEAIDWARA